MARGDRIRRTNQQRGSVRVTGLTIALLGMVLLAIVVARQVLQRPVNADVVAITPHPIAVYGTVQQVNGSTVLLNDGVSTWSFAITPATNIRKVISLDSIVQSETIAVSGLAKGQTASIKFDANSDPPLTIIDLDVIETR